MPRTYPDTQAGVNDQEEPKPSFYAIIPASVRYCKELQPAAKLLFGELVALTTTSGYCYAQNPYFMHLYGVDRSTIKRWLASLADQGFIRIENELSTNERRIYVIAMLPGGVAQKRATSGAKMSHPRRKNEPQSITENITKNNTTTLNVVGGPPQSQKPQAKKQEAEGENASPSAVYLDFDTSAVSVEPISWKSKALLDVIEATKDTKSTKRFRQLLEVADRAGASSAWQDALDALKQRTRASAGPVERPGAYFCAVLVSALNERGVSVPVGTPSARRSVKSAIVASFLAAGQEGQE